MTQVSWTRQLALASALFILGSVAYWIEFKHKPQQEASEEQAKKLFQLKDVSVESIRMSSGVPIHPEIQLKCLDLAAKLCKPGDPSKWQITQPMQLKADDSNVNALLSALNNLTSPEVINIKDETPEKRAALLKDYGLDAESRKTNRKVEVVTASGATTLYFGSTHPIGEGIFSVEEHAGKVDESQVYLVPNYFKSNLEHDLSHWRDKKLLTLTSNEVESFQLDGAKGSLTAEKKNGQWTLKSAGNELPGDTDLINSVLSAAAYLSAKTFVSDHKDDETAQTALKGANKVLTLKMQKEKGPTAQAPEPVTIVFWNKKGSVPPPHPKAPKNANPSSQNSSDQLFATVSNLDPLFELDAKTLEKLDKSAKDLRLSKLMTTLERFNIKKLEFSGKRMGASPLVLTQTDGKWVFDQNKSEADSTRVQSLLDKLSGAKVEEFLSGSALPKGDESAIELTATDDKITKKWVFWRKGPTTYVKDTQSPRTEVLVMEKAMTDAFPWTNDFFKKEEPTPNPTAKK